MTNRINSFKRMTLILLILLFTYLIAILIGSDFWGNVLSPINAYAGAVILLSTYLKSKNKLKTITYLFYSIAAFSWAVADTMWLIYTVNNINPENSNIIILFYAIPNLMIFLAIYIFAIRQFKKWNYIQLGIDVFIVTCLSLLLVWETFLHKDIFLLNMMLQSDYTSVISIISDILIGIGILTCFLSVRSGNIPAFIKFISVGILLYVSADMFYYYTYYNNQYIPNTILDFVYILAFQILAFGSQIKTNKIYGLSNLMVLNNEGIRSKWLYLFMFPLVAVFFMITKLFSTNLNLWDITLYVLLIFFYKAACKYIQISIENERLLEYQKQMNVILEQRVEDQISKLSYLENQDTLTSLFNRRYFMSCLDNAIATKLDGDLISVLLIDIDRFKTINDSFGHDIGDKVLIEASNRITKWNRYGASIARLGGDEFALILIGKYTRNEIEKFCNEIIELFSKPINVGFDSLQITISLGAALYSSDSKNSTDLMKNADIAMYRAKSQGYNKYLFFNPFFNKQINKNIEIERLLRKANIEKDFELFYQPQFSLPDKALIGAEALVRWRTPEHGYIPPNEFIPIAEEINFISEIGKWVMYETVRQGAIWNNEHNLQLKIGFNVSAKQLGEESFAEALEYIAKDENFHAGWIDAEITESIMIADKSKVETIFNLFSHLGISVSIDDFGSGYSSFRYLNELPFDKIKIDKSLIDKVSTDNFSSVQVVNAIISMAKAVGVKTIAEGVETQEQLDILTELGCDQVQGYLLGRPVPSEIFESRFILSQLNEPLSIKNTTVLKTS